MTLSVTTPIHQTIQHRLTEIEAEHDVRVLLAVESGSRAWGFASTNSDYDIRFLYLHKPDWYLRIDDGRDVIEYPIVDDLDFAGWDLRKALRLFRKSNPPLLEWLRSPIVYQEQSSLAGELRGLQNQFFSPRACLHHYLSMAVGNYKDYLLGNIVKTKKYFYVLRPLLACRWIEQHQTVPPMEFDTLLATQLPPGVINDDVQQLLVRKKQGVEFGQEPRLPRINAYLEETIAYFTEYSHQIESPATPDTERLNQLFRHLLPEVWG